MTARDQLLLVLALAGLCLLGYLALDGHNNLAFAIGALVGFLLGYRLIGRALGSAPPARLVVGIVVGLALFGYLLLHMTNSELNYMNLGAQEGRVRAVTFAVVGLFAGVAARVAWLVLPRAR